jgi:hypothetical protein
LPTFRTSLALPPEVGVQVPFMHLHLSSGWGDNRSQWRIGYEREAIVGRVGCIFAVPLLHRLRQCCGRVRSRLSPWAVRRMSGQSRSRSRTGCGGTGSGSAGSGGLRCWFALASRSKALRRPLTACRSFAPGPLRSVRGGSWRWPTSILRTRPAGDRQPRCSRAMRRGGSLPISPNYRSCCKSRSHRCLACTAARF